MTSLLTSQGRGLRAVLNNSGNNIQALAFDPWGHRRNAADWPSLLALYQPGWDSSHTTRGFTSHEHLDALGLIHMNGQVYDPYLGRFTSADPFIQFPHHSQSYNRYSYVLNNPLSYTDPSGHFLFTLGAIAYAAINTTLTIYQVGALFAAAGFADTLVAGGSFDQALKTGLISGVSAGAFSAAGAAWSGQVICDNPVKLLS